MSDHLGELIEPLSLAEKGRTLTGQLPLSRLDRLCQSLQDGKGEVGVSLHFDKDEVGQPRVMGRLAAILQLQCQRCMQAMDMPVSVDVHLGIVEDELILALPLVALHEMKDCPAADAQVGQDEQNKVSPQRENPFAVLAELKKERND